MATEICLTLQTLSQKIERLLEDYPESFYNFVLTEPEVQQQLLTRVLSQLPHCYLSKTPGTFCFALEPGEYIDDLIWRSINQTLHDTQLKDLLLSGLDKQKQPSLSTCAA